MTQREISVMLFATTEKKIGELELRFRRPVGVAYTERQRRRDQIALARCYAVIDEETAILRALDAAAIAARRRAA